MNTLMPIILTQTSDNRFYNEERRVYVSLDEVKEMVSKNADVHVFDATSGLEVTSQVLVQILVDHSQARDTPLPVAFLNQVVRHQDRDLPATTSANDVTHSLVRRSSNALVPRPASEAMQLNSNGLSAMAVAPGPGQVGLPRNPTKPNYIPMAAAAVIFFGFAFATGAIAFAVTSNESTSPTVAVTQETTVDTREETASKVAKKTHKVAPQKVAKRTVAKRTVAKRTVAKRTVAKRTVAKRTVAKRTVAKRTVAKRTVAKRTVAKRTVAKRTVAKRATKRAIARSEVKVAKAAPRLTSSLIRRGINKNLGKASKCSNTNIKHRAKGAGLLVDHCPSYKSSDALQSMSLLVSPSGDVVDAHFKSGSVTSSKIGNCVLESVKKWKFPAFDEGTGLKVITQRVQFESCVPINGVCIF